MQSITRQMQRGHLQYNENTNLFTRTTVKVNNRKMTRGRLLQKFTINPVLPRYSNKGKGVKPKQTF